VRRLVAAAAALALLPVAGATAVRAAGGVQVDNSLANGAATGTVLRASPDGALVEVHNPHQFWTNVVLPAAGAGVTFQPAPPSPSDPLGGFYARAGVIAPGADAVWQARFPSANSSQVVVVSPAFAVSPDAGALTIATVLVSMVGGVARAKTADDILRAAHLLLTVPTIDAAIEAVDQRDAYGFAVALYDSIGDHADRLVIVRTLSLLGVSVTEQALKRVLVVWTIFELMQLAADEISARILGTAQGNVTFENVPAAPPGSPLLVVDAALEQSASSTASRVSLVATDGKVVASADYQAPTPPNVGNAAPVLPAHVVAARHAVYFADASGTVRRLSVDGVTQVVASFPLHPRRDVPIGASGGRSSYDQQEIALAVSPDGRQLAAVIYTLPDAVLDPSCPPEQGPGCTRFMPPSIHVDVYRAWVAGPSWLVHSEDVPDDRYDWTSRYPILVGWDAQGPIGVLQRIEAVQDGGPWQYAAFGGYPAHLDPLGHPGPAIGGADCLAWTELDDQELLCQPGGYRRAAVSLRKPDGTADWNVPLPRSIESIVSLAISPDGGRVAVGDFGTAVVVDRAGGTVTLPKGFDPIVWLDPQTVAGDAFDSHSYTIDGVTLVSMAAPGRLTVLDVRGRIVGTLAAP